MKNRFPETVTELGVSAKIRKVSQTINGVSYVRYVADFIELGKRKQVGRASYDEARQIALDACRKTANGSHSAIDLPLVDRLSFVRSSEILAPFRMPVDSACREYADAVQILGGKASLAEACREWIKRNAATPHQITISAAADTLIDEYKADGKSQDRIKAVSAALSSLAEHFSAVNVSNITPGLVSQYLMGLPHGDRTKKNHRDTIGLFCRWLCLRGYLAKGSDWLEDVQNYSKAKTGVISIFTPDEVKKLLSKANGLTAFVAIAAFAGIRHEEICRLDWKDIDLKDGFIEIAAAKSKVNVRRLPPIHDNLKAWLMSIKQDAGPVVPQAMFETDGKRASGRIATKAILKLAKDAGIAWKRNALRHSFISYRVAECADVPRVADEAGTSPEVIRTNYLRRVKPVQATEWFSILWLAHAVKVVRPAARRLHLDRVRFAIGWHLGITLGVCMSGFGNLVKLADSG